MSNWSRKRADNIQKNVPIARFLSDLGYQVRADLDGDREQQFSCDLHGDGMDQRQSARVYASSNSWYCFGCNKSRDAIQTLRDKSGATFNEACREIEKRYGLAAPTWEPKNDETPRDPRESIRSVVPRGFSYEMQLSRVQVLLQGLTEERTLPMGKTLALWEAFDLIKWQVESAGYDQQKAIMTLEKVRRKAMADALERT